MGERAARVLLVEDMEVNQKLAIAMLGKLGHEVEISGDGLAAVRKMQSFERGEIAFDLVFMDIQLPEIDGLEATRRIRRLGPRGKGIPIIGLSANAYATDVTACLDAGMNDHLGKPFSMESLSRSIARWCKPSSKETRSPVDPEILASLEPMFLEQCAAAADLVVRLSTALGQGATDDVREVSQTLRQACHNLSGTAQTFGRADLGRVAAMAENCLKLFPDRGDWAALSEAIDDLNLQLAATSEQLTQLKAQRSGVA
jgi:CheY-like chemotaxis protein